MSSRKLTLFATESSPWHEVAKRFGPTKPLLLRVGDRQPVQQTPVVPQRQGLRLVVYLPVHFPLPPTRGTTTAQPTLYPTLLKPKPRSWRQRILMSYLPTFRYEDICELRLYRVLRSSHPAVWLLLVLYDP